VTDLRLVSQLEAELDLARTESARLESALTELRDDYAKLNAHYSQTCEILNAYAPRSVVRLGHE
jgi:hypothetical protein